MVAAAKRLATLGWTVRSGAADGADTAFERGALAGGGKTEIWLPWPGFNGHADTGLYPLPVHYAHAQQHHPAWEHLGRGPRALHARNVGQVLGADLASPVRFVLCYTPDGCESLEGRSRTTGGTGMAIAIAVGAGVPVYNLANSDALPRVAKFLTSLQGTRP